MHPAQVKRRMRGRLNMPIDIDHAYEKYPYGHPNQSAGLALQLLREQQREWHRKSKQSQKEADRCRNFYAMGLSFWLYDPMW